MSVTDEYRRQHAWRSWQAAFDALPPLAGQTVLDLGCALGDQTAALLAGGAARVIGFDANQELLDAARARHLAGAEFRHADLAQLADCGTQADGIWCGFTAAYFVDFERVLRLWRHLLRPGGWIALTEIDDLFGHAPLEEKAQTLLREYVADAFAAGRYDFHAGHKLPASLKRAGFSIKRVFSLADREFAFEGPALQEVVEAWRLRFERMVLLRRFCGTDFVAVRDQFLACLASRDHRSQARVRFCLATKPHVPVG